MDAGVLETTSVASLRDWLRVSKGSCPVVTIETTLSVGEALARLAEFRLLSAPLVIRLDASPDNYTILAWLGIGDLLRHFLEMSAAQLDAMPADVAREAELARLGVSFATSPVVGVHTAADEESTLMYWGGVKDLSVASLCRHMLRLPLVRPPRTMRGRVGFFDTHGKLDSLISTSDVISFAASAPGQLPCRATTLYELGLVSGAPRTVPITMTTYLALREVAECRAVGVVDSSGRLVAAFSVSELRGMREADFGSLALPVGRWLHAKLGVPEPTIAGADDPWAAALLAARAVVALPPDAPLSAALAAVDSHKVHQIFVVDASSRPLAMVTQAQLVHALL